MYYDHIPVPRYCNQDNQHAVVMYQWLYSNCPRYERFSMAQVSRLTGISYHLIQKAFQNGACLEFWAEALNALRKAGWPEAVVAIKDDNLYIFEAELMPEVEIAISNARAFKQRSVRLARSGD
jgi:hypothetical protein